MKSDRKRYTGRTQTGKQHVSRTTAEETGILAGFSLGASVNSLMELQRITTVSRSRGADFQGARVAVAQGEALLAQLERQVVLGDAVGPALVAEEVILRTVSLCVGLGLFELSKAISTILGTPATEALDELGVDWWRRFLEAISHGHDELSRIGRIWLPYRPSNEETFKEERLRIYRDAMQEAADALRRMDRIPELERVLYRGIASKKWSRIAGLCEWVLAALHARIDLAALHVRGDLTIQVQRVIKPGAERCQYPEEDR